jgi:hypothetical protein
MKRFYSSRHIGITSRDFNIDHESIADLLDERKKKRLEDHNKLLFKSLMVLKAGAIEALTEKM